LLHGFKNATLDKTSVAKVADFGTAREDDRNAGNQLRTSAMTHAFTRQVAGTTPYMPNEYIQNGHVSEKTDAFAFGILVIEVLTNLKPIEARTLVDDHEITTLPGVLNRYAVQGGWPTRAAQLLSEVGTSCTRGTKSRATVAGVMAQVEAASK
jgi:serine/threonine protein kinase